MAAGTATARTAIIPTRARARTLAALLTPLRTRLPMASASFACGAHWCPRMREKTTIALHGGRCCCCARELEIKRLSPCASVSDAPVRLGQDRLGVLESDRMRWSEGALCGLRHTASTEKNGSFFNWLVSLYHITSTR